MPAPSASLDTLDYRLAQTLDKLNQGNRLYTQVLAEESAVHLTPSRASSTSVLLSCH
ncbi:hypothetical protein [Polaromonas hydrogenivorans]|uniref:Uncharacterized protein n=1 Tax=Polaromonas hydrogenivorans TaxID=335476 RepID=A0AAU7M010_9BURK